MNKDIILGKIKEQITESNGNNKDLLDLQEADIELGEEQQVYCRTYEYTCTGAGQKFGGDFRFPLTKTYKSDAKWFYEGDKNSAKMFLIRYAGGKKMLEKLGGCFVEGDAYGAVSFDAEVKLREDFRMYDCRVLPESVRVDDFEEVYKSSPVFRPIYRSNDSKKVPVAYVVRHAAGEMVLLAEDNHNSESGNAPKINWFLIIAGLFCFPILLVYLIYLLCKKK